MDARRLERMAGPAAIRPVRRQLTAPSRHRLAAMTGHKASIKRSTASTGTAGMRLAGPVTTGKRAPHSG